MGTRSLTVFQEDGQDVMVMYRQYDGYPSGHGLELTEFLSKFSMVNGFGDKVENIANGIGCLAAQTVCNFKKGVGGFYIEPCGTRDAGSEYHYYVSINKRGGLNVQIYDVYDKKTLFNGTVKSAYKFCKKQK